MTLLSCSCIPDTQQLYSNKCSFCGATMFKDAFLVQTVVKHVLVAPGVIGTH